MVYLNRFPHQRMGILIMPWLSTPSFFRWDETILWFYEGNGCCVNLLVTITPHLTHRITKYCFASSSIASKENGCYICLSAQILTLLEYTKITVKFVDTYIVFSADFRLYFNKTWKIPPKGIFCSETMVRYHRKDEKYVWGCIRGKIGLIPDCMRRDNLDRTPIRGRRVEARGIWDWYHWGKPNGYTQCGIKSLCGNRVLVMNGKSLKWFPNRQVSRVW